MPKPGYSSITIRTEAFKCLKKRAKLHKRSMSKELEHMIELQKEAV